MKNLHTQQEAKDGLTSGANKLANIVKVTLGPKGQNVFIQKGVYPKVSKDGVTVAKEVFLEDPLENMGAQTLKSASVQTDELIGDGTTTATVIAQAILNSKTEYENLNTMILVKEMQGIGDAIVEELKKKSTKVGNDLDLIRKVATVSANNDDQLGNLIADAYEKTGFQGLIMVEDSPSEKTYMNFIEGMKFDRGYLSPFFLANPVDRNVQFKDTLIMLCASELVNYHEVLPVLELCAEQGRPLLIIANDIKGEALSLLIRNKMGGFPVVAVGTPGPVQDRIEYLRDIAFLTDAVVVNDENSPEAKDIELDMLGTCQRVVVDGSSTSIVMEKGKKNEMLDKRIEQLKGLISDTKEDYFKTVYKTRIAKLTTGIAVIYVGGYTPAEVTEKKYRAVDAVHATHAAVDEGFLPGGGIALLRCIPFVKSLSRMTAGNNNEFHAAKNILIDALSAPLLQILENCGIIDQPKIDMYKIICENTNYDFGYDGKSEALTTLISSGVIDAAKVTRIALVNGISAAGMIWTVGGAITEIPQEEKKTPLFG